MYGFHRDKQNRPIFIYNLRRQLDAGLDDETMLNVVDFFAGYNMHNALQPGKVETWNMVLDVKGIGLTEFPVYALVSSNLRMKQAYKVRLHNLIVVNVDWRIKLACKFIYNFLSNRIAEKILVFADNGKDYLV